MYKGSCLCGKVQIAIDGAISDIIHCHCSLCRKNSGTAYATNGFVEREDFTFVSGEHELSQFSYKANRVRHFCKHCGSPVYSENLEDIQRIRLRLGLLDTPIIERPMSHNFVTSKANWEEMDAKLPRYEAFEPERQK
ncbi:GFA family protein [Thalassotalea hakodatensis]|uniref:GFA family protein n=1 Tax=Thalassotalea hakodatensis TaxID=3030492 RepID=UPI002572919E|nr:GFA family protein [Thalassotalea hakodatensis]